jgi:hypothetical protein
MAGPDGPEREGNMRRRQAHLAAAVVLVIAALLAGCGSKEPRVTEESRKFTDEGCLVYFSPSATYSFSLDDHGKYNVYPAYSVYQTIRAQSPGFSVIEEVSVRNVKVTKQPKFGTISVAIDTDGAKASGKDFATWTGYAYSQRSQGIVFHLRSTPLGDHVLGKDFSGTHGADWAFFQFAARTGLKSEDLRFGLSYRLEVVAAGNKRFLLDKEIELLPGDFIKQGAGRYELVRTEPFKQQ